MIWKSLAAELNVPPSRGALEPSHAGRVGTKQEIIHRGLLVGVLVAIGLSVAWAHDPGISTAQGEIRAGELTLTTGFAPADIQTLLPTGVPRSETWGPVEFDRVREDLLAIGLRLWEVRGITETVLPIREVRVELLPGDNVSFVSRISGLPIDGAVKLVAPQIAHLPAGHRQFVIIADAKGSTLAKKLLGARDFTLEFKPAGGAESGAGTAAREPDPVDDLPSVGAFLRLGVVHIWTGYDHLLFLFALLVVCRTFRSIVAIVTCFTLAHSLTLALSTLDLVSLPARVVEPLIAASIVFVGVENLASKGKEPRGRWALTFGFGLIHGFGFASVLRDLGVGGGISGIAMPLFTFNLGVELGQVAVAGLVMPVVWRLRRNGTFVARGVPALSALVAAAGLYWLVQRTLLT